MRIGINELDRDLIAKIKKLDELELNYSPDDGNIVMYNGEGYYTGKYASFKKMYFDDNMIYNFKKHLYKSGENYFSSFDKNVLKSNIFSSSLKNCLTNIEGGFVSKTDADVLKFKEFGANYYAYSASGKLYEINKFNPTTQTIYDIFSLLKTHFAFSQLNPYMVSDFIVYDNGFLVAVLGAGVYYINIKKGIYELKYNLASVTHLVGINDRIILTSKDKNYTVVIADFKTGKIIEKYNNVSLEYQTPDILEPINNKDFVVIGKSNNLNSTANILHYWKLNNESLAYENIDYMLPENKCSIYYEPKFLNVINNNLYISGVFKEQIFIWRYDLINLSSKPEEILIDCLDVNYDDLYCLSIVEDGYYFIIKNRLIKIVDNQIIENAKLNKFLTTSEVYFYNNKFIAIDKKDIMSYSLPKYNFYPEVKFNIYNLPDPCNNINIFIDSKLGNEEITFYNATTMDQIIPEFFGVDLENNYLISIKDCLSTNIEMIIQFKKDSEINGIVINPNQEYFDK